MKQIANDNSQQRDILKKAEELDHSTRLFVHCIVDKLNYKVNWELALEVLRRKEVRKMWMEGVGGGRSYEVLRVRCGSML